MGSRPNKRVKLNADFIFDQPLPSDRKKFIRVGDAYQAELPQCIGGSFVEQSSLTTDQTTLLWCPSSQANNTDKQVDAYLETAVTAAVKTSVNNKEHALHVLHETKGDISAATLMLTPGTAPEILVGHPILNYTYAECDAWSDEDIEKFCESLHLNNKNFFKISKDVQTKTVKQCVQYYYVWKKKNHDIYSSILPKKKVVKIQPIIGNPHNTRGSAKRAVAAAVQNTNDLPEEQAKMRRRGTALPPCDSLSQPPSSSCKTHATEREDEEMSSVDTNDANVISEKADTTTLVPVKVQTKTVKQCVEFDDVRKKKCNDKYKSVLPQKKVVQVQPIIGNPHNTRGNVKRAVAASEQKAKDIGVEQSKMNGADAALELHDSLSQPTNGSCKISHETERVAEAMGCVDINDEHVINQKANRTKLARSKCFSSKRSLQSKSRAQTTSQRKLSAHAPILVSDQPRESVFPCEKCERVFAKIKSRNGHMKHHKIR